MKLSDVIMGAPSPYDYGRPRGRFAPSPSGRMHLGNIYAALMSYLSVKTRGGEWVLRIEDNDPQRSKREYADLIMDDLSWLGMSWDDGPYYQSERTPIYEAYFSQLESMGVLYPCHCTRAELRAPHASDLHSPYSGKCRPAMPLTELPHSPANVRVRTDHVAPVSDIIRFDDALLGPQEISVAAQFGDFVIRRRDGAWAYQFAVTIDDSLMNITEVVRGDDLLTSTAPQIYLTRLLGISTPGRYVHLPLLRNDAGQRLSKRDCSLSMDQLRLRHSPRDIIAMICRGAGLHPDTVLQYLSLPG